ncbi:MAG: matrixin family metalloprotease [Myxococcales bacterium]|nr:matrixin family metalloprotease [Myxococcales bacterium]
MDGDVTVDLDFGAELHGIAAGDAEREARATFGAWGQGLESHLAISFEVGETGLGTGRDGLNVVRWGTDADDEHVDPLALGTTYLTYRTSSGQILEADIVVNGVNYEWTTSESDCSDRYDLQNILAHETGHLLGIAHSVDHYESTMFPSAAKCETKKRGLSIDDQDAATFLYDSIALEAPGGNPVEELVNCSTSGDSGLLGAVMLLGVVGLMRRRSVAGTGLGCAFLVICGASGTSDASTLLHLEASELVARADVVVQGTVVKQEVILANGQPTTVSTIAVVRCAEKACPGTISVRQFGGEIGGIGLIVSGVHHLEVGRELVLFLRQTKSGLRPVGRAQGIFEVRRENGREVLRRDLRGSVLTRGGKAYEGRINIMSRVQFDLFVGPNLL